LLVLQPVFKLEEDISPCPFHASLPVPAEVPSVNGVIHAIEEIEIRALLFVGYDTRTGNQWGKLTMS
jgi:hypothetical protein